MFSLYLKILFIEEEHNRGEIQLDTKGSLKIRRSVKYSLTVF